jgi:hypothetical protein
MNWKPDYLPARTPYVASVTIRETETGEKQCKN